MEVKVVLTLLLTLVVTSAAQKKCCFPLQFEMLNGQLVGTVSQGTPVAVLESIQLAYDSVNNRAGQISVIQDGTMEYQYQVIVDYNKGVEYIIQSHLKTCQMLMLPSKNMTYCVPESAEYVTTVYVGTGENKMTADQFSLAVKEGTVEGTNIFTVSKEDCVLTSSTFIGTQQGTPVLEVAGFVNYTWGIFDTSKYFTVPDYCSESQSFSKGPRQYHSFMHRFL